LVVVTVINEPDTKANDT